MSKRLISIGNPNKEAGYRLVRNGVKLANVIGATEFIFPMYFQSNYKLWQYFIFSSDEIGADWRKVEGPEDAYHLVMVHKGKHPGFQGIFYTFPDIDGLPDHSSYYRRPDSIIVFSIGEKLNPVTIEETVVAAILIEPVKNPKTYEEAEELLDKIWPYVAKVNEETVAHERIGRKFMALPKLEKPFHRAGKGTVQRASTLEAYNDEFDKIYDKVDQPFDDSAPQIDASTEGTPVESIKTIFENRLGFEGELGPDTDFFTAGIDSLLVINASRTLHRAVETAGDHVTTKTLATRAIYGNPALQKLARYIYSVLKVEAKSNHSATGKHEAHVMESLWKKYTNNIPTKLEGRPNSMDQGQITLLTESTGMLGSYMLGLMAKNPAVNKIICLNRAEDGGVERQTESVKDRGLSAEFASKTKFLYADMPRSDLGLSSEVYNRLLNDADRIIHNAWPVNSNMHVESFESHIRSVRNIVDFATNSAKRVAVVFISSIGTVDHWDSSNGAVPEERLEDFKLAGGGYGQSKMVGNLILEDVAKTGDFPAAIIRVEQIAGPEDEAGCWNKYDHLGVMDRVDWTPAEGIANLVLEVAGVSQKVADDISGYYHGINHYATTWAELAPAVQEFYGKDRIPELISFGDWVDRPEKSQADHIRTLEKSPGIKLIDSYRRMSDAYKAGQKPVVCDMKHTTQRSPTMKSAKAVTPELMKHWCKQWGFKQ
ncbi:male sterility protein-domain-containing protein [Hypoxylon sp. FL0890]|nr:male sterility protein-domain-containing protein [Hypoxylon sp. FL0890]